MFLVNLFNILSTFQVPFSKMLTFYRKDPFILKGQYSHPSPSPDPAIGLFTVKNIVPNAEGESQKVRMFF